MIEELAVKVDRLKYFVCAVPIIFAFFWPLFIFKYYNFVISYKYDKGFLSNYSDVPYSFLVDAFKWVENDSLAKGYDDYIVSSDFNYSKELRLNTTQRYYWDVILDKKGGGSKGNIGYYLMYFSPIDPNHLGEYTQFGPYMVYETNKD